MTGVPVVESSREVTWHDLECSKLPTPVEPA
jgi:hypothetical protein